MEDTYSFVSIIHFKLFLWNFLLKDMSWQLNEENACNTLSIQFH